MDDWSPDMPDRRVSAASRQLALDTARAQGAADARLYARLEVIERHQSAVNGSISDTGTALRQLVSDVTRISTDQLQRDAAAAALATQRTVDTDKLATARSLYATAATVVGALTGLYLILPH